MLFINKQGRLVAMPESDNPRLDFEAVKWLDTIDRISNIGNSLMWNKSN